MKSIASCLKAKSEPSECALGEKKASTFAGNLTILGSIANIIVIEGASSRVKIGFLEYLKVGLPLTVLSLMAGVIILSLF